MFGEMALRTLSLAAMAAAFLCGCGRDAEPPPWERDAAPASRDAGGARDAGPTFQEVRSTALPPGTRTIRAGGFSADVQGEVLAILETDLDGDGRPDVVAATRPAATVADAAPASVVLAQISAYRTSPNSLALLSGDQDPVEVPRLCDPDVKLRRPTRRSLVVDVTNDCPEEFLRTSGVCSASGIPRARLRATLTGRGRDPGSVAIEPTDLDGDGRDDAVVRLRLKTPHGDVEVPLRYVDRASGFAADTTEPEATYAALVERASRKNVPAPERADRLRRVLAARRLLCEGAFGDVRLAIGAGSPRRCEASAAIGRAVDKLVRAEIDRGDAVAARRALAELSGAGVSLGEEARTSLERAVDEASPTLAAHAVRGPSLDAVPGVRQGALRFLDETRILVAGRTILRADTGATEPAPEEIDLRVLSPDGATAIFAVGDRCGDPVVLLCAATARCAFDDPGANVLALRATPSSAPCPAVRSATSPRVLGWTSEGILWTTSADPDVLVTPASGGPPHPLAIPFDPPPGAPFADHGRLAVFADAAGLWLRESTLPPRTSRIVPEGVSPPWDAFTDLTLSPSGRAIAAVRDGVVWVLRMEPAP